MAQVTVEQAVQAGLQHHMAGRLGEAEGIYRQVLGRDPNQVEALHLLGALAHQVGKSEAGVELLRRAVGLRPGYVEAWNNLGLALQQVGKVDEAVGCYRRALALQPTLAEAHSNLGFALFEKREFEESEAACRRAVELRPEFASGHHNWGNALAELGRKEEAVAAFRRAIAIQADYAEVHASLGVVLAEMGQGAEGVRELVRSVELKPDHLNGWGNLAEVLIGQKRGAEAVKAARRAVALGPTEARVWRALGNALGSQKVVEEAVAALRKAAELAPGKLEPLIDMGVVLANNGREVEALAVFEGITEKEPEHVIALSNIGQLQREAGRVEAGLAACQRAVDLAPEFADAHANLALGLLVGGDFKRGWVEYDWRLKSRAFNLRRKFTQPMWRGEDVARKRFFLWYEQGLGDTIQFVRYVKLLAERGATVVLECQRELGRLLREGAVEGLARVMVDGEGGAVPEFDVHCPLMSVPGAMGTTGETIPWSGAYVRAGEERVRVWGERMGGKESSEVQRVEAQKEKGEEGLGSGVEGLGGKRMFRVGLAWAGNPGHRQDRKRSIRLEMLRGLGRVEGVEWYSLQKGMQAGQLGEMRKAAGMGREGKGEVRDVRTGGEWNIIDFTEKLTDFAETAGLVANLDLVITVDSAVAHLAGAMGKRVWVLLPYAPDWRWLLTGERTAWYPTMRLFRQSEAGRWEAVVERVKEELGRLRERGNEGMTND